MNVFKKIVFVLLFQAVSNICFTQEVSIRGGFNLSQMPLKSNGQVIDKNSNLKTGLHFGPIIDFRINNLLSCETGLQYTSKGFREIIDHPGSTKSLIKVDIAYLNVPLTAKLSFPYRNATFLGNAGGYIATGLFGNILTMNDINGIYGSWQKIVWGDQGEDLRRLDYGLNFGIGIKYKALEYGLCYEIGLADLVIGDPPSNSTNNRTLEFYISYKL